MTTTTLDDAAPGVIEAGASAPSPPSQTAPSQSPKQAQTKDASFVAALEAVDAFLEAQEQLTLALRDAHHALSRAKYALAASGGAVSALLPLRSPPPPVDGCGDGGDEVQAERWVELVSGGGKEEDEHFELRAGPLAVARRTTSKRRDDGGGNGGNKDDANNPQQQPLLYDDPRSPPPPCPEAIARADAARLRWAGASGALPPPALRDAQARFGAALAAAVRSASRARAVLKRAEGVAEER